MTADAASPRSSPPPWSATRASWARTRRDGAALGERREAARPIVRSFNGRLVKTIATSIAFGFDVMDPIDHLP